VDKDHGGQGAGGRHVRSWVRELSAGETGQAERGQTDSMNHV
jgi:hypothetical protein